MSKEHLEHRKRVKAKKPDFVRQDSALKRLEKKWVRPKGLDSKRRLKKDGHQKRPSRGYSSPASVKGLNPEGLREVVINTISDISLVTEGCVGILGRRVGARKMLAILDEAKSKNVQIINVKHEEIKKKQDEKIKANKSKRKQKADSKKTEKKEEKKTEKKEEVKEEKAKEDKKKVLENKQNVKAGY